MGFGVPAGKTTWFSSLRRLLVGDASLFPAVGCMALEVLVVLLLLVVVTFTRLLGLEPIEVGGDAITVWEFARNLAQGGELPSKFNHHTARFGLVLPSLAIQCIGSSSPVNYFLGPLAASVLLHLCVYLIGRKLSGPVAGTIAVVGLLSFEPMIRASSQILPEAFGPAYVSLSVLAALQFTDSSSKWGARVWLLICAVAMVFAYGSKESYLYFAPAVAMILWLGRPVTSNTDPARATSRREDESQVRYWARRLLSFSRSRGLVTPALLALAIVLVGVIEWVFFASVTENQTGGRLSIVTGSHSAKGALDRYQLHEVGDFFSLYTRAPDDWIFVLGLGVLALLGVSAFARDRRAKIYAGGVFVYFLLQTFVLRSFSPPIPWMEPHPRYLIALAAPIALLIAIFVTDALRKMIIGSSEEPRFLKPVLWRILALLASLMVFSRLGADLKDEWESRWGKSDSWHRTQRMGVELTQAFRAGVPIVSDTPMGKPAWAAASVYIDPNELFIDGSFAQGKFLRKLDGGRYAVRALGLSSQKKKALDNAVRRRLQQKKCLVHLQQRTRGLHGRTKVPVGCDSLEAELEADPSVGRPVKRPKKNTSGRRER
jgi:hypothetical protein